MLETLFCIHAKGYHKMRRRVCSIKNPGKISARGRGIMEMVERMDG
jgi:hypothetical protein